MVLNIRPIIRCTPRLFLLLSIVLVAGDFMSQIETEANPLIAVLGLSSKQKWNHLKPPESLDDSQQATTQDELRNRISKKSFAPFFGRTTTIYQQQPPPPPPPPPQQQQQQQYHYQQQQPHQHHNYQQQQQQQQQPYVGWKWSYLESRVPPPPPPAPLPQVVGTGGENVTLVRGSLHKALMGLQNPRLWGGDILLRVGGQGRGVRGQPNRHLIKFERSALVSQVSLWAGGVIYYELDPSVSQLTSLIYEVMQQFHDETCIKFIPRKNNEPDYLRIEALKGCFSYIGRVGGEQTVSLGDGCEYRGTIAHELLHAVGFYHHQNRSDRDDYLEILWDNIARGKESQFHKMEPEENILLNEFDYNSIMLYGPRTFGKTLDKFTMKPKQEGVVLLEVVEKQGLSLLDVDSVNKLYKCGTY